MTLVDTNVLLDLLGSDGGWAAWSEAALEGAATRGALFINDVVYAELCIGFDRMEDCDAFLEDIGIAILPMPRGALFLAGRAYMAYRRHGGTRAGVLPDFFIGAHASHEALPLLTRDVGRYRTYFPALSLIHP